MGIPRAKLRRCIWLLRPKGRAGKGKRRVRKAMMPHECAPGCAREGLASELGQSTLEYMVVTLGILAVVIALGAMARAASSGVLARLATHAASHSVGEGVVAALLDVLLF